MPGKTLVKKLACTRTDAQSLIGRFPAHGRKPCRDIRRQGATQQHFHAVTHKMTIGRHRVRGKAGQFQNTVGSGRDIFQSVQERAVEIKDHGTE